MKIIEQSSVVLATHSRIYSASQAMRDYLRRQGCRDLLYVSHPLPLSDVKDDERSTMEMSRGKRIVQTHTMPFRVRNIVISSILEAIQSLYWVLRTGKHYDLFVGVDNLNALQGLFLKRLGRVKRVVYYTIDYFPTRFANTYMNSIYHAIDLYCVRQADETWNVSVAMVEARKKFHHLNETVGMQYTVPIGIWFHNIKRLPLARIHKSEIIFSGHLVPHMGVDMLISALPDIIARVPTATLTVVGGGEQLNALRKLARQMHLEEKIRFYGWVTDRIQLERILCNGRVGVAPFNTEILDEKVKNADPGKLKDYMACGLPVVVTDAISTARDLDSNRCGFVVPYRKEALVRAIVRLLTDAALYREYRNHAISYVKQFDYDYLYGTHLARVLAI